MVRMRLGKKVKWKDIKVGEVFAQDGCINIFAKVSKTLALLLTYDYCFYEELEGEQHTFKYWIMNGTNSWSNYKLPKDVQACWKEE